MRRPVNVVEVCGYEKLCWAAGSEALSCADVIRVVVVVEFKD